MKQFHDFRDIEISNTELLKIIADKHQLDTHALDNYSSKNKNKISPYNSKNSTEVSTHSNSNSNHINNKKTLNDSFNNAFKIKDNIKFEFMKGDKREYPPRLIPRGIKSDRSNTVVITKKCKI